MECLKDQVLILVIWVTLQINKIINCLYCLLKPNRWHQHRHMSAVIARKYSRKWINLSDIFHHFISIHGLLSVILKVAQKHLREKTIWSDIKNQDMLQLRIGSNWNVNTMECHLITVWWHFLIGINYENM